MWDFSVTRALGLMFKTSPFVLLRMAVYFGAALAYVLVTGAGAGIGWGIGGFGDTGFQAGATIWGGVIGFGLVGVVMYLAREYVLYIVKAGHIAVLVKLLDGEQMPEGRSQVAYARQEVTKRFAQASVLFGVDQLVKGVRSAITGLVRGIVSILPIPGAQQLVSIFQAFLRVAVGFIDEVILAYAIRIKSDNAWASAQTGLVLYAQNYKPMLKNAASRARCRARSAAAGTSIMIPARSIPASAARAVNHSASSASVTIGAITLSSAGAPRAATASAASWEESISGCRCIMRSPRSPSAGLGSSPGGGRNASGLSAPASRVRTTTLAPGPNASSAAR